MLRKNRDQPYYNKKKDALRQDIRERILLKALIEENVPLEYEGSYDGYGDSGNYHCHTGDEEVDAFLTAMLDKHVQFDWYNNEGGGGTITWQIKEDIITIDGFQNQIVRNDVLDLEL
jgi:hypothetical protein